MNAPKALGDSRLTFTTLYDRLRKCGQHGIGIPDDRVVKGFGSLIGTHDAPGGAPHSHLVANIEMPEALAHQVAHDELVQARPEEPALDDMKLGIHLPPFGRDGVQAHGAALVLTVHRVDEHEYSAYDEWLACLVALDAWLVENAADDGPRQVTLQGRLRSSRKDDDAVLAGIGCDELAQTLTQSKHRHQHARDSRDADHRDCRSAQSLGNAAKRGRGEKSRLANGVHPKPSTVRERVGYAQAQPAPGGGGSSRQCEHHRTGNADHEDDWRDGNRADLLARDREQPRAQ